MSTKTQKIIDAIIQLKSELNGWKNLTEDEILKAIKGFEKNLRAEGSSFYNEHFSDVDFANTLLEIAEAYKSNKKVNIFIISSLGYMMQRYKLPETDSLYHFFVCNSQKKGLAVHVAFFLTTMKYFENHPDKWEYIMSIKEMKPAKLGASIFEMVVESKLNEVPNQYKRIIVEFFKKKAEIANSPSGKQHFLTLAEQFK